LKILVVGDWHSDLHEEAVANAFESLGHNVVKFAWHHYFRAETLLERFIFKIQNRFLIGPIVQKINNDLFNKVLVAEPDFVFIYRGTHIKRETLLRIKQALPKTLVVGYNNDDPFSERHDRFLWKYFLDSIPAYDLLFAYRHRNINDFYNAGAKRVELLRSWYIPEKNYPVELSADEKLKYQCDVVFIGHFENDGREQYIEALIESGFSVKVFGPEWPSVCRRSKKLKHLGKIIPVRKSEYNKALSGAKIALCFLSKLNRDTYTRRCFEIPATKTLLCSERTDDLINLFDENEEALFFDSKEELISQVSKVINNDVLLKQISEAGFQKLQLQGHDVVSRMRAALETISSMKRAYRKNEFNV
jgi:spore maturation protein CgeB